MAIDVKPILRTTTALQSLALLDRNLHLIKKKRKRARDFARAGAENIVGVALIQEQSKFIEGF